MTKRKFKNILKIAFKIAKYQIEEKAQTEPMNRLRWDDSHFDARELHKADLDNLDILIVQIDKMSKNFNKSYTSISWDGKPSFNENVSWKLSNWLPVYFDNRSIAQSELRLIDSRGMLIIISIIQSQT